MHWTGNLTYLSKMLTRHLEGKEGLYEMRIKKASNKRTVRQNAYWFAVLDSHAVPVFREHGDAWCNYTIHCYVMEQLGYAEAIALPDGEIFWKRKTSTGFSTKEWEEFMEAARAFLLINHGIDIPLPNEGTE